jgi:PQQ-like domain
MKSRRRFLGWSLFLGFLWAVGWAVFGYVRHTPRCVIIGQLSFQHLSPDGSQLITVKRPKDWNSLDHHRICGPLQVWDLRTGKPVRETHRDGDIWVTALSPSSHHAAILPGDGTLHLFDWNTGQEWPLPLENDLPGDNEFSPKGRWLRIGTRTAHHFIDVQQHKIAQTLKEHFLCFNPDERAVFLNEETGRNISIVDLATGERIASATLGSGYRLACSDGSILAAWRGNGESIPNRVRTEQNHGIELWDLTTLKLVAHWMAPEPLVHLSSQAVFSRDSRILAYWHVEAGQLVVQFFDTVDGVPLGRSKLAAKGAADIEIGAIPPDGSLWYCRHVQQEGTQLTVLESATGRTLWQRPYDAEHIMHVANQTVFWSDDDRHFSTIQALDARTGIRKGATVNVAGPWHVTPDGCHWLAHRFWGDRDPVFWEAWLEERLPEQFGADRDKVMVFESATGRELFRASGGVDAFWNSLSDDGSTLLTTDRSDPEGRDLIIKAWDVSPTRAYVRAFATAAATGIMLLGLRWLWRKRKARRSVAQPSISPT